MDTKSFAQSLKGTVPDMDNMILVAADTSGKLPDGLRFLAESVRSVEAIKGALISAVAIPVLISSMMVGMVYGFGKWMVPILTSIIPVEHWPTLGQWMYHISSVLVKYGPALLGGLAALSTVFIWSLSNWTGNLRVKFDNYLPYALYRDYNGALMLVSMGGLMQANSSLAGALRLLKTSATPWMTWHLTKILRMLDKEASEPVKAFDTGVLPQELYERVADYGERSGFQNAMSKIGSQSLERVMALVQKRAKVLNNILLVFTGITLALMISSVMLTAQSARTEVMSKMNSVH
jgi:type II secretory pathway component PulF